jgi:hypothetical protein
VVLPLSFPPRMIDYNPPRRRRVVLPLSFLPRMIDYNPPRRRMVVLPLSFLPRMIDYNPPRRRMVVLPLSFLPRHQQWERGPISCSPPPDHTSSVVAPSLARQQDLLGARYWDHREPGSSSMVLTR